MSCVSSNKLTDIKMFSIGWIEYCVATMPLSRVARALGPLPCRVTWQIRNGREAQQLATDLDPHWLSRRNCLPSEGTEIGG